MPAAAESYRPLKWSSLIGIHRASTLPENNFMKTVAAVFSSLSEAGEACFNLRHIGVPQSDISLIAGNEARRHDEYLDNSRKASASTMAVAVSDASLGGGMGILAMLIAFA